MVLLLFNVIQFGVSEQRTTFCAHQQLKVGVVVAAGTRMRVYCARVNNFCVALPSSCARHTHSRYRESQHKLVTPIVASQ